MVSGESVYASKLLNLKTSSKGLRLEPDFCYELEFNDDVGYIDTRTSRRARLQGQVSELRHVSECERMKAKKGHGLNGCSYCLKESGYVACGFDELCDAMCFACFKRSRAKNPGAAIASAVGLLSATQFKDAWYRKLVVDAECASCHIYSPTLDARLKNISGRPVESLDATNIDACADYYLWIDKKKHLSNLPVPVPKGFDIIVWCGCCQAIVLRTKTCGMYQIVESKRCMHINKSVLIRCEIIDASLPSSAAKDEGYDYESEMRSVAGYSIPELHEVCRGEPGRYVDIPFHLEGRNSEDLPEHMDGMLHGEGTSASSRIRQSVLEKKVVHAVGAESDMPVSSSESSFWSKTELDGDGTRACEALSYVARAWCGDVPDDVSNAVVGSLAAMVSSRVLGDREIQCSMAAYNSGNSSVSSIQSLGEGCNGASASSDVATRSLQQYNSNQGGEVRGHESVENVNVGDESPIESMTGGETRAQTASSCPAADDRADGKQVLHDVSEMHTGSMRPLECIECSNSGCFKLDLVKEPDRYERDLHDEAGHTSGGVGDYPRIPGPSESASAWVPKMMSISELATCKAITLAARTVNLYGLWRKYVGLIGSADELRKIFGQANDTIVIQCMTRLATLMSVGSTVLEDGNIAGLHGLVVSTGLCSCGMVELHMMAGKAVDCVGSACINFACMDTECLTGASRCIIVARLVSEYALWPSALRVIQIALDGLSTGVSKGHAKSWQLESTSGKAHLQIAVIAGVADSFCAAGPRCFLHRVSQLWASKHSGRWTVPPALNQVCCVSSYTRVAFSTAVRKTGHLMSAGSQEAALALISCIAPTTPERLMQAAYLQCFGQPLQAADSWLDGVKAWNYYTKRGMIDGLFQVEWEGMLLLCAAASLMMTVEGSSILPNGIKIMTEPTDIISVLIAWDKLLRCVL